VKIEIELMEVLFLNLSLESFLVMKILMFSRSSRSRTGVLPPGLSGFASSSPFAQLFQDFSFVIAHNGQVQTVRSFSVAQRT
jgi:hypothetical protein